MPTAPYLVSLESEESYCQKYGLGLTRLKNGIKIISVTRASDDRAQTDLRLLSPIGAAFDPSGKEGIHHLTEHLLANNPSQTTKWLYDVNYNSSTGANSFAVYMSGTTNLKDQDYGLFPAMGHLPDIVHSPLSLVSDLEDRLNKEKNTVLMELQEDQANQTNMAYKFMRQCVYAENNPINVDILGTGESLTRITKTDIEYCASHIFDPRDTIISSLVQGKKKLGDIINRSIVELVSSLKPIGTRPDLIKARDFDKLKKLFKQGNFYKQASPLKTGLVTVYFLWDLKAANFSVEKLSLQRFMYEVNKKLMISVRKLGISYSFSSFINEIGWENHITGFWIQIAKSADIESKIKNELKALLIKNIFDDFSDKDIEYIIWKSQKTANIPVAKESILQWGIYGLREEGQLIDMNYLDSQYRSISQSHLKAWQEKFLSTPPAIVVYGDIE